jgi:O-antigen biosynthesis protein
MPSTEARGSICFAANDLAYLVRNGGVGTYFWGAAHLLAADGWRVHVLFCGAVEDRQAVLGVRERLSAAGIGFSLLGDLPPPPHADLEQHGGNWATRRSDHVRHALAALHAEHRFDLIEFAEWQGMGFRPVQARRTGVGLTDVRLMVKLHGSSQWGREGNHQWLGGVEELRTDYGERYSFENADVQLAPCRYMLGYARTAGWDVRDEARVVGYAFPEPAGGLADCDGTVNELVFFGRLETRKGLEVFLDAVRDLDPSLKLTFLGKDTDLPDAGWASDLVRTSLPGRKVTILTDRNQEQAVAYLRGRGRLAVMPSLMDNFPFTVIECATQGIPFLASDVGGIPEILPDADLHRRLLFAPKPAALAACLDAYLALSPAERLDLRRRVLDVTDPATNNRRLAAHYREILATGAQDKETRRQGDKESGSFSLSPCLLVSLSPPPPVSVVVSHYNLGAYLPEALASLDAQTYHPLDVIVVDDGSTCPESRRAVDEMEGRYPHFRFVRQANAGCGAARNRGLDEARGEAVVFFDADNVALPHLVETLARGLERNPDLAGLACYVRGFRDHPPGQERRFEWVTTFTGGPHVLSCFQNVYGDTNAILRASALRAVGGYENDRGSPWEDWMTFVKLYNAGHRLDVVPEYLFDYRVRGDGRVLTMNRGRHDQYAHTVGLLRRCFLRAGPLPEAELAALWTALVSFRYQPTAPAPTDDKLTGQMALRLRNALERVNRQLKRVPLVQRGLKRLVRLSLRAWDRLRRRAG